MAISLIGVNGIQTGVNSTSLNTLSTSGVITAGNTVDGSAPHGLNEFIGYIHTSLSDFPSLASWDTYNSRYVSGAYTQAEAFCSISFQNDTGNKRIIITYYGGTNAAFATVYTTYMSYSGYTGNINVQYNGSTPLVNADSGSSSYPPYGWPGNTSNSGTYTNSGALKAMATNFVIPTAGTVQFKWFIRTNAQGSNSSGTETVNHSGVTFNINFTSNSTAYSKTSGSKNIELLANKGGFIP
jgi:hypothetical protein